ncbi:HAD family hydrolase [Streptomyces sp. JV190]|uniref:HAD family hydrolase n=1 Tax=Streptomyces sp. JV190 TaxID=3002533 RepID=UPI002E77C0FB|nr:HAD family phosphatase [Streptomyces sp. JV190]MEE1839298.1 HAD family phosphatase [Streptomyces sp. JV190]
METRCVVLDIGGVLEMTPATGWDERWERRLGLPTGSLHRRLDGIWEAGSVGRITEDEVRARVAAVLGLDAVRTDAFMADLWDEYLGSPNEELIAYVRSLRTRCRLGILSNSFVGAREREQKLYGFGDLVDDIVYSHEIGVGKPAAAAFEVTCARLGVRPGDCLFVDDIGANIAAAEAFGMRGILFTDNAETIAGIEAHLACRHAP